MLVCPLCTVWHTRFLHFRTSCTHRLLLGTLLAVGIFLLSSFRVDILKTEDVWLFDFTMASFYNHLRSMKDHLAAFADSERIHELLLSIRERVLEPTLVHVQRATRLSQVVGWIIEFAIDAAQKAEGVLLPRRPVRPAPRQRRNRAPGGL